MRGAEPWFLELSAETNVEPLEKRTKRRFDRHSHAHLRTPSVNLSHPLHHVRPLLRSAHRWPRRPRRAPSRRPRRARAAAVRVRAEAEESAEAATTKVADAVASADAEWAEKAEAPAAPAAFNAAIDPADGSVAEAAPSATTCPCSTTPWWPSRSPAPSRSSTAAPP